MFYRYKEFPFPHIIIDKFYSDIELVDIFNELNCLQTSNAFLRENMTGSAHCNGNLLKRNSGVFLYEYYKDNHENSHILKHSKIFDPLFIESICNLHWVFKYLKYSDKDGILLNYYDSDDYYEAHFDCSTLTCIRWLYNEPKQFTGGELYFPEFDYSLNCYNNTGILFPSCVLHEVSKVNLKTEKFGRYSIAQFITFK